MATGDHFFMAKTSYISEMIMKSALY